MTYPFGYPLASGADSRKAQEAGASGRLSATNGSAPAVPSATRISAAKLARIDAELSVRDREIMETVRRFRVLTGRQLQRLYWPTGSTQTRERLARHGLSRLTRLQVLAHLGRRIGGVRAGSSGRCFALGIAGQRLREKNRSARYPHTPGERYLAHHLAVAELYVRIVEAERWGLARLHQYSPEPECWRSYAGAWGVPAKLKSDAFVKVAAGDWSYSWWIEIDRATEALPTVRRKAREHLTYHETGTELSEHGVAPRVLWLVPDATRAQQLTDLFARLGPTPRRLFAIATFEDALTTLIGGSR